MAIIRDPQPFTLEFGVSQDVFRAESIFDPILNVDTPLFIDPLLLKKSVHPIISGRATDKLRERFSSVYEIISLGDGDVYYDALVELTKFDEIASTCLGYTAGGIGGHGFGPEKSRRFIARAAQLHAAGRSAPELLPSLAVLESGIGADLISDMTTNIIAEELCRLTEEFCLRHGVPVDDFEFDWGRCSLPRNRYTNSRKHIPVLLVPSDILRELPQTNSWDDVVKLTQKNATLRRRVSQFIGEIMRDAQKSINQRRILAAEALQSEAEAVARVAEFLAEQPRVAYPTFEDPHTTRIVQRVLGVVEHKFPLAKPLMPPGTAGEMVTLVREVCEQFKFLVEMHEVWKMFWADGKRLREEVPQKVFHVIAHSYCAHYNVHIAVEHHTANGRTDFVFSQGSNIVVVVELKWSDNPKLLSGYAKQVKDYIRAERAKHAIYLIMDCDEGKAYAKFQKEIAKPHVKCDDITVVLTDANPKISPSKAAPM